MQSQGFNPEAPTVWTIEGLLQYIEAPDVDRLFARVDALSAPGSVLLYDVVGKTLLEAPFLRSTLEFMQKLGAPWVFGSDTPAALVEDRGWTATVTDMAVPGNKWKRWAHPAIPADVPNAPRGYFVEASQGLRRYPPSPPSPPPLGTVVSLSPVPLPGALPCMYLWPGACSSSSCFGQYAFAEIVAN